jgi:hypothetical protein
MHSALAALAVASFALSASAQTTWYVDVNGTPPGTGTAEDPFVSIQQGVDSPAVAAGDTLLVAPGVYAEKVSLVGKPLTLVSQAGPMETWIEPVLTGANAIVVRLAGSSSTTSTIEGFTVSGAKCLDSIGIWGQNDIVRRCIVSGHEDIGIYSNYDVWVERCTIVGNHTGKANFHINFMYVSDSLLAHNTFDMDPSGTNLHVSYSLVQAGGAGATNLSGDPKLWNPDQGDLRLGPLSPCIDAGDPTAPPDPDGSPRDMGALTYDAAYVPPTLVYCTAKLNSDGCTVDIGWSGGVSASASAPTPFVVSAQGVLANTPGLLFYGFGRRAVPFLGGWHCVEPPTPRVGGQNSGASSGPCTGSFAFDFNAWVQSGADPKLVPGTMVDAQWWYRDLLDPQAFFSSTSDAIEFAVAP